MNIHKLTQEPRAAMQAAQALRHGHVEVDGEHLLLARWCMAKGWCRAFLED